MVTTFVIDLATLLYLTLFIHIVFLTKVIKNCHVSFIE